jgi:predicted ArsR family transcriptional regulator
MRDTKFGRDFFESSRGRIVNLLRGGDSTVEELARQLELTDNAVRAHLATLERDGLVERRGVRKASRKPHFIYALAPEAEQLFPKAYHLLLDRLLTVLKRRLSPEELEDVLREVARSLAAGLTPGKRRESVESRAQRVVSALEALGGAPRLKKEGGALLIRSGSCPFAATVTEYPEVCRMTEVFLSEISGLEARQHCLRQPTPQCSFTLAQPPKSRRSA